MGRQPTKHTNEKSYHPATRPGYLFRLRQRVIVTNQGSTFHNLIGTIMEFPAAKQAGYLVLFSAEQMRFGPDREQAREHGCVSPDGSCLVPFWEYELGEL